MILSRQISCTFTWWAIVDRNFPQPTASVDMKPGLWASRWACQIRTQFSQMNVGVCVAAAWISRCMVGNKCVHSLYIVFVCLCLCAHVHVCITLLASYQLIMRLSPWASQQWQPHAHLSAFCSLAHESRWSFFIPSFWNQILVPKRSVFRRQSVLDCMDAYLRFPYIESAAKRRISLKSTRSP